MKTGDLDRLRKRIGKLNRRILDDLNERLRLVGEVRQVKVEQGLPFHDPKREAAMLRELAAMNEGPLTEAQLERIYRAIFKSGLEYLKAGDGGARKRRPPRRTS
ncbi:MAG: chorismate mutase [Myxococcales bacterium]